MLTEHEKERIGYVRSALPYDGESRTVTVNAKHMTTLLKALDRFHEVGHENKLLKAEVNRLKRDIRHNEEVKRLKKEIHLLKVQVNYYQKTYGTDPRTRKKYSELPD